MAKKRPCFLLERDQKLIIDELTDEEAGIIFKAIYEYETTGKEINLDKSLRIVFKQFKVKLDFYDKNYEDRCLINKENAEKRWEKYKNAIEYDGIQSNAMDTNKRKEKKNKENKRKEKKVCVITHIPDTHTTVFDYSVLTFPNYEKNDLEKSCKKFFKFYKEKDWEGVNNWQEKLEMWIEDDIDKGKIKEISNEEEYIDEAGFIHRNGRRVL